MMRPLFTLISFALLAACVLAAPASVRWAVNCAIIDDGSRLLSTSAAPGDFAVCTYKDAGPCTYFAAHGSFSSGSSTCPSPYRHVLFATFLLSTTFACTATPLTYGYRLFNCEEYPKTTYHMGRWRRVRGAHDREASKTGMTTLNSTPKAREAHRPTHPPLTITTFALHHHIQNTSTRSPRIAPRTGTTSTKTKRRTQRHLSQCMHKHRITHPPGPLLTETMKASTHGLTLLISPMYISPPRCDPVANVDPDLISPQNFMKIISTCSLRSPGP
ncbi:unnamed protein product [Mycena citricolor]|uniref:Uncharacterized protein n=1 Tax=Mycena citricolor TaxID=2018698 RepID=A0AAD2HYF7_9AGAR|nr:unnamed protein product [Mycena citricolor]